MANHKFDEFTNIPITGYYEEKPRKIPIVEEVDVLVVGGSPSGVAAAVCAARNGAKVRLVEQYGFLGGQNVYTLVVQWEKRAYINNLGAVATRGIAKEMLDSILEKGGSDGMWEGPYGCEEMRDGEEWLDIEAIKMTLIEFCEDAGVKLLFHTKAVDSIVDDSTGKLPKLTGAIFENKSGRFAIKAKVVVDGTADLDLVWWAVKEKGAFALPPQERVDAGFYVWYGGVDNEKFIDYALGLKSLKGYPNPQKFPDKLRRHLKEGKNIILSGFKEILVEADEKGLMEPIFDAMDKAGTMGFILIQMKNVKDMWCMHLFPMKGLNTLDTWQVTAFEILRIKLQNLVLPVLKLMPGWENASVARDSIHIGKRETRLLKAVTMLTEKDIYAPDHDRPDCIGRSGGHDAGKNKLKKAYPIPYGIMVPKNLDGVICCTKALGLEGLHPKRAHRGITPTIVVGQAAGTAAALAAKNSVEIRDVDMKELRDVLRKADVVLDVETVDLGIEIKDVKPVRI
ncbi:MAG: FAD-dependent oxidoreductase [Candidatus Hodarchaeota archaeon]